MIMVLAPKKKSVQAERAASIARFELAAALRGRRGGDPPRSGSQATRRGSISRRLSEHNKEGAVMPKMKTKKSAAKRFRVRPGRHRQARPGVQAPHPDQEVHQEQAPPARRRHACMRPTWVTWRRCCRSPASDPLTTQGEHTCLASNVVSPPAPATRKFSPSPRASAAAAERLPHRQGSGDAAPANTPTATAAPRSASSASSGSPVSTPRPASLGLTYSQFMATA